MGCFAEEINCSAVIHMDPVCVSEEEINKVKEKVRELDENYFVVIDVDKECR